METIGEDVTESTLSIQIELERIKLEEKELMNEMQNFLLQKEFLNGKIKGLSKLLPALREIKTEAQSLVGTINDISHSSECISGKIRSLDTARSHVDDCQRRVSDLIDLDLCSRGVQQAIQNEDYETGAGHVFRFLAIDQNLLRNSASDIENVSGVLRAVRTLQDATGQLCDIVKHRFKRAVHDKDLASVERFFKIYPLLGLHDEGIQDFCQYLCTKLEDTAQKNLDTALKTPLIDPRHSVLYSDTLTLLFEGIARLIDSHQPIIETYYGPGRLLAAVTCLQAECDRQARHVTRAFVQQRQLAAKLTAVGNAGTPGVNSVARQEGAVVGVDPKELDTLIGELTVMHARVELYVRFITKKVTSDIEVGITDESQRAVRLAELEKLLKNSQLSQCKHELLGYYLKLDQYFMEESVAKAVAMDSTSDTGEDSHTSSMVDDTFFIIKKCIRRAITTGSLDGCCAVINTGCRVLESDFCDVLKARLRQGYPVGYLDLTQAYNVLHSSIQQGRLQPSDAELTRHTFLVALNNADSATEYVESLCDSVLVEIEQAMPTMRANDRGKLESCLSGLSAVTASLKCDVIEYGMQQLRASAVKPRVSNWVDAFLNVSHHLSDDELSVYEAGTSFVQTLMMHLDNLLLSFKQNLTDGNYDTFVAVVTTEVTQRMEKVILKSTFNRLGGLVLDKEVRTLAGYLTTSTSWTVRDKFARLTQMATVLNLDKVSEVGDYWGSHEGALTWRLTPAELRSILALRSDFKIDDIRRLKL